MTERPAPRKSALAGRHAAAPDAQAAPAVEAPPTTVAARPRTKKLSGRRPQIVFYTDEELAGQVRAAVQEVPYSRTGYRSMSDLIDHAVRTHIAQLQEEHNNGQPWEHRHPGDVGTGRRGI